MSTALCTSIRPLLQAIGGLTTRPAQSLDRLEREGLLRPWPGSLIAFHRIWRRLA
jgi:hypothetical protein